METLDLQCICSYVVDVAKEAGGIIRLARPNSAGRMEKKNSK